MRKEKRGGEIGRVREEWMEGERDRVREWKEVRRERVNRET